MSFGQKFIQLPATLNFRNSIGEVDTADRDTRNAYIAAMNREARIARLEREREYNE